MSCSGSDARIGFSSDGGNGRGDFYRIAEAAGHHDIAGSEHLAALQGKSAIGFEVEAQAPLAIDIDAVAGGLGAYLSAQSGDSHPNAGSW